MEMNHRIPPHLFHVAPLDLYLQNYLATCGIGKSATFQQLWHKISQLYAICSKQPSHINSWGKFVLRCSLQQCLHNDGSHFNIYDSQPLMYIQIIFFSFLQCIFLFVTKMNINFPQTHDDYYKIHNKASLQCTKLIILYGSEVDLYCYLLSWHVSHT